MKQIENHKKYHDLLPIDSGNYFIEMLFDALNSRRTGTLFQNSFDRYRLIADFLRNADFTDYDVPGVDKPWEVIVDGFDHLAIAVMKHLIALTDSFSNFVDDDDEYAFGLSSSVGKISTFGGILYLWIELKPKGLGRVRFEVALATAIAPISDPKEDATLLNTSNKRNERQDFIVPVNQEHNELFSTLKATLSKIGDEYQLTQSIENFSGYIATVLVGQYPLNDALLALKFSVFLEPGLVEVRTKENLVNLDVFAKR